MREKDNSFGILWVRGGVHAQIDPYPRQRNKQIEKNAQSYKAEPAFSDVTVEQTSPKLHAGNEIEKKWAHSHQWSQWKCGDRWHGAQEKEVFS